MQNKSLFINTLGCQMNVYDSQRIEAALRPLGYYHTATDPETADLIIVNTCSIREKAEEKVYSFLGRLAALKKQRPFLLIGVGGCVAQQEGKRILKRAPMVDFVFGTHAIGRLPGIVKKVETAKLRLVDVEFSDGAEMFRDYFLPGRECFGDSHIPRGSSSAFVTVMQGCDNYCSYCVVPYVRGREASRKPDDILEEIRYLAESGIREVTLLGQNVNSYGKKEGLCTFAQLLRRIDEIKGLKRMRFTTSHPKDLSEELIAAFAQIDKLCRHIHLPVQSGSNRILQLMNRKYTREGYLEKIEKLRHVCPSISITSDFIVGFPSESREEFEQTLDLVKTADYDGIFAFKYSDRPNTPASRFSGKVDEEEKRVRLQRLLDVQKERTLEKNRERIGKTEWVLVDGVSKKQEKQAETKNSCGIQWTGRTTGNKIVNFTVNGSKTKNSDTLFSDLTGKMVRVKIRNAYPHSLEGIPLFTNANPEKGEQVYAS